MKTPGFYGNANSHICSICLRLEVSWLTEIQYLQIENQVKKEHIPIKASCLKSFICTDSSDEQSAFDGL